MCRLLGYVATGPVSLQGLLGAAGFDEFTALSARHADGWGMAWVDSAGTVVRERSAEPAQRSARYHELAATALSDAGIVHLRWATPPHEVVEANAHPFLADGLAFAHNGAASPAAALEDMLDDTRRAELVGGTDSERYFALVRARAAAAGGDLVAGLRAALAEIPARAHASSLNCLLLDAATLHAVSCHDEAYSPLPGQPDYFALRWRRLRDAVVVASSGWSQQDWDEVPNGHALLVSLSSLRTEVVAVGDPAALAGAAAQPNGSARQPVQPAGVDRSS